MNVPMSVIGFELALEAARREMRSAMPDAPVLGNGCGEPRTTPRTAGALWRNGSAVQPRAPLPGRGRMVLARALRSLADRLEPSHYPQCP